MRLEEKLGIRIALKKIFSLKVLEMIKMKAILYSSPGCAYCHLLKIFFKKQGIEFEEIDISKNEKAKKELEEKGFLKVPVTKIGTELIAGYDTEKIKKLLEK